jgi:hypothetical protein
MSPISRNRVAVFFGVLLPSLFISLLTFLLGRHAATSSYFSLLVVVTYEPSAPADTPEKPNEVQTKMASELTMIGFILSRRYCCSLKTTSKG